MHELSLAQSVVGIVENAAQANKVLKVSKVQLTVGKLAGVEMQSFNQGLKIASRGTVMQDAEIEITRPDGTAWCMDCAQTVPLKKYGDPCPLCGGFKLTVNGGTDFKVTGIIVESEEK